MGSENQQYSRQELLAALDPGWKRYLSRLHELSGEEQLLYAQAQGFSRVQDVLVHTMAWWERSMQRSFVVLSGHLVPLANDMDEFNAEVIERYQSWTREAVEEKFAAVLTTFERFLKELPETAFANERIQLWLRIDAIDHYEDHRLPNAPKLRTG
jgi:hypothetical protein